MSKPVKIDARIGRASGLSVEDLKAVYKGSVLLRNTYKKILTDELESLIIRSEGEDVVGNLPLLSHLAGQRASLRSVLKLFEDLEQPT